jgi:hypothetical protein
MHLKLTLILLVLFSIEISAQKIHFTKKNKSYSVLKKGEWVIPFYEKDSLFEQINWKSICKEREKKFKSLFYQIDSISSDYFLGKKPCYSFDTISIDSLTPNQVSFYYKNGGYEMTSFKINKKWFVIFAKLDSIETKRFYFNELYSLTFSTISNYKLINYYTTNGGLMLLGTLSLLSLTNQNQSVLSKITYGLFPIPFWGAYENSKYNRRIHFLMKDWEIVVKK